jgi:hypothetical protein
MSPLQRYIDACIASTARRWPAELADDMSRTWHAEIAAVRDDDALPALTRAWRQIAFATSLATSRSADTAELTWRDRLPGLGQATITLAGIGGVALLATVLPDVLRGFWGNLDQHLPDSVYIFAAPITALAAIWVMWCLGSATGHRTLIATAHRSVFVTVTSRIAALGVAVALVMTLDLSDSGFFGAHMPTMFQVILPTMVWVLLLSTALVAAGVLIRSGRHRTASWVGIIGTLVALDVSTGLGALSVARSAHIHADTAPAWFPLALLDPGYITFGPLHPDGTIRIGGITFGTDTPIHASTALMHAISGSNEAFTLAAAFALAYALRAARAVAARPAIAVRPVGVPVAKIASPAIALGVAVAGLVVWAVTTTAIPLPDVDGISGSDLPSTSMLVWAGFAATVLVACASIVLNAGRGPVAAPAAGVFTVLFAVQSMTVRHRWHGIGVTATVIALGGAALAGAWWLTSRLPSAGTTTTGARRALVAVAVAASLATPTYINRNPLTPTAFNALQYVVTALFWLLAVTAALASRRSALPRAVVVLLLVVPLAALLLSLSGTLADALYFPAAGFFIQAPLAVVALAAARWDAPTSRVRAAGGWILLGIAAAALSVNVGHSLLITDTLFDLPILWTNGVARVGSNTDVIGQTLLAIAVCLVASRWAVPPDTPAPPSDLSPAPLPPDDAAVIV